MPFEPDSDDALAGPELTNEEVYSKYAGELIRFATGLVGPWEAEDVLSGAVLSAMYSRHWPAVKNPRAYLYRSVLNEALQTQRSAASRRLREIRTSSRDDWDDANQHPEVLEVVRGLSVRQRAVIVLTYWHDLDPSQVARLLAISEGAVKRHLARARTHLRKRLQYE
jgi:RNA polymerase sigma factor (sigma-70 family)